MPRAQTQEFEEIKKLESDPNKKISADELILKPYKLIEELQ